MASIEDLKIDPGTVVGGRFRVEKEIGRGGMGRVLLALDEKFGARVALKVTLLEGAAFEQARQRFVREARIGNKLGKSAGFVRALDWGEIDRSTLYLAMDLVEGAKPLELKKGPLKERLVRLEKTTRLVAEAHRQGIVHRDLKPQNVLEDERGELWLSDFGLAKAIGVVDDSTSAAVTAPGVFLGTPSYMPPEQFDDAKNVDARADVYALGVMLYVALTEKLPFPGNLASILSGQQRAASDRESFPRALAVRSDFPASLSSLAERAMALRPDERLGSAEELARELHAGIELLDSPLEPTVIENEPRAMPAALPTPARGTRIDRPLEQSASTVGDHLLAPSLAVTKRPPTPQPLPRPTPPALEPVVGRAGTRREKKPSEQPKTLRSPEEPELAPPKARVEKPRTEASVEPIERASSRGGALRFAIFVGVVAGALALAWWKRVELARLLSPSPSPSPESSPDTPAQARLKLIAAAQRALGTPQTRSDDVAALVARWNELVASLGAVEARELDERVLHNLEALVLARRALERRAVEESKLQATHDACVSIASHVTSSEKSALEARAAELAQLATVKARWKVAGVTFVGTLADAIEGATGQGPEAPLVELSAGEHAAPDLLAINHPLKLHGAGQEKTTIAGEGGEHLLKLEKTKGVSLEGIHFVHKGTKPADVVLVTDAEVTLEQCHLSGAVGVEGRRLGSGLRVIYAGHVKATSCLFDGNAHAGATFEGESSGELKKCTSTRNRNGLFAGEKSTVTVEEGELEENNELGALLVGAQVTSTLLKVKLKKNHSYGVQINDGVKARVEGCDASENGAAGIHVLGASKAMIVKNTCAGNAHMGIRVSDKAEPHLEENAFLENKNHGIHFAKGSSGVAHKNRCEKNTQCGIMIEEGATPTIADNECHLNVEHGIMIRTGGQPVIEKNNVTHNKPPDIFYEQPRK